MLYSKIFKQKERTDLIDLLSNRRAMNYDAKSALFELINTDEFFNSKYGTEINDLKAEIEEEDASIASFDYLKYLGFKIFRDENNIKITRLSQFYLVDLMGILIGGLLAGMAYFAWPEWNYIYQNGMSVVPVVMAVVSSVISLIGVLLVIRCISRYFEYAGFEIIKNASGLRIKKRNDVFVDSILVHESKLDLLETNHDISLVYHNDRGEAIPIIKTKGGMKVRRTLVHLKDLLATP